MEEHKSGATRVGVVGLGLMGQRMLGSFAAHAEFDVVAGFDMAGETSAAQAEAFSFQSVASLEELLGREDLDLLYVATPPASHVPIARRVLKSGRPLFLEKPLSVDLEGAAELVEVGESSGLPAALNFPLASMPGLGHFAEELADGTAGRVVRVEVVLHFSQWPRTWHTAGEWLAGGREGGFLREVYSHFAYLTQRLLGPQRIVHKSVERSGDRGETRVVADLLAGDVPVSLVGGVGGAAPDFNRWTLFCESRSYRLEDWGKVSVSDGGPWQEWTAQARGARDASTQLDQLTALLHGEPSCLPTLRDGLDVMRVVEGLLA